MVKSRFLDCLRFRYGLKSFGEGGGEMVETHPVGLRIPRSGQEYPFVADHVGTLPVARRLLEDTLVPDDEHSVPAGEDPYLFPSAGYRYLAADDTCLHKVEAPSVESQLLAPCDRDCRDPFDGGSLYVDGNLKGILGKVPCRMRQAVGRTGQGKQ